MSHFKFLYQAEEINMAFQVLDNGKTQLLKNIGTAALDQSKDLCSIVCDSV